MEENYIFPFRIRFENYHFISLLMIQRVLLLGCKNSWNCAVLFFSRHLDGVHVLFLCTNLYTFVYFYQPRVLILSCVYYSYYESRKVPKVIIIVIMSIMLALFKSHNQTRTKEWMHLCAHILFTSLHSNRCRSRNYYFYSNILALNCYSFFNS